MIKIIKKIRRNFRIFRASNFNFILIFIILKIFITSAKSSIILIPFPYDFADGLRI